MELTPKTRFLLTIVLPLLVIVISYTIYFAPNIEKLQKMKIENQSLKEEIDRVHKISAKYEDIKAKNEQLKRRLEYFESFLPTETEVSNILKRVSKDAVQKGLSITLWRPKEKTVHESQQVYQIPVEIKMKGKYHNFGLFFSDIAKIERIININTMDFKAGNLDERGQVNLEKDPTILNVNLTITTYSLIPEEEKKKIKEKEQKKEESKT